MTRKNFLIFNFFQAVLQYLLVLGLIFGITAALFTVREQLDITLVALLYLIPVGFSTSYFGLVPGITCATAAFLSFNYFFIPPYYNFNVHRPTDVAILIMFLVVAIVFSQLVGRLKKSLATANAGEWEATQLFELSTALGGLQDTRGILKTLEKHIHEALKCEAVEIITIGLEPGEALLSTPVRPARKPELTLPLQLAHAVLGEILIWRVFPALTVNEKRVLQTFASQGALALERARLAKNEARTKILEESDRLKSALLSSVSHELRTPLSTIKAAASSLRSNEVDLHSAAGPELIAAIDDEADHLNMLVGNLLDMSRIEGGVFKPKKEWNILSEIVGSVLSRMKHLSDKHIVKVDIPDDMPLVPVDFVQLEQVFSNLLSNSVKYAPEKTIILIRAEVYATYFRVIVMNQGPQIPRENLIRIFDKFFRINASDRVTGTGLGLSICKGIIEAHEGKIWAENVPGGLAFNFELPLIWEGVAPPKMPEEVESA